MAIKFKCPKCAAKQTAVESQAGEKANCVACGQALRVPRPKGEPAREPAAQGSPPFGATEIFGFAQPPSGLPTRGVRPDDGLFADVPARGVYTESEPDEKLPPCDHYAPMSAAKKKRVAKNAVKHDRERPSFAGAGMGISFGTMLALAFFGWRIFSTYQRIERAAAVYNAADPDAGKDVKTLMKEEDARIDADLKRPGSGEARAWLDVKKHPNHVAWEMSIADALDLTERFYKAGAAKVYVVDPAEILGKLAASEFAIELPKDPAARKKCFDVPRDIEEDPEDVVDHGQKYLSWFSD